MRLRLGVGLFALVVGSACGESRAPERVITMTTALRLTGLADSLDLAPRPPVISKSGFIVAHTLDVPDGGLALYDSTGRYLRRVGALGQGPGEFEYVNAVGFGAGDSLWVVDGLRRAQVFSPAPDVRYVRTQRLDRFVGGGVVTPQGLVAIAYWTPAGVQAPALVDGDGRVATLYGGARDWSDSENFPPGVLTPLDSTRVWIAFHGDFAIELLASTGAVLQRIEPEHPWFPPDRPTVRSMTDPPLPAIRALATDSAGVLWVLLKRPTDEWTPPTRLSAGPWTPQELRRAIVDPLANFESRLEVLDTRSGEIIATAPASGRSIGFVGNSLLCEVEQDADGFVTLHLQRLSLR